MEKQRLRGHLEELDAELRRAETIDEGEREVLRRLQEDIRDVLAREGERPQNYEGLRERLRESVARLEASHPAVTMLMRQLIDQLAFMGI